MVNIDQLNPTISLSGKNKLHTLTVLGEWRLPVFLVEPCPKSLVKSRSTALRGLRLSQTQYKAWQTHTILPLHGPGMRKTHSLFLLWNLRIRWFENNSLIIYMWKKTFIKIALTIWLFIVKSTKYIVYSNR